MSLVNAQERRAFVDDVIRSMSHVVDPGDQVPLPPARSLDSASGSHGNDDDDDDEDDDSGNDLWRSSVARDYNVPLNLPPPPPPAAPPVAPASVVSCPVCQEETPYIDDAAIGAAVNDRIANCRDVIFRFERTVSGRLHDETVLFAVLALRRLLVEQHLEAYSFVRFRRWTLPMLREHYDPANGHRHDLVRILDAEARALKRLNDLVEKEGLYLTNHDTGERTLNLRAVEVRLRGSKSYIDVVHAKEKALSSRDATLASVANVVESIHGASTMLASSTARKRARVDDGSVRELYAIGGFE